MSAPEKKPPQKQNGAGTYLQEFALEIGSTKGLDPVPPDQYLTYMEKRYAPAIRLWAWMLAHTIRQRNKNPDKGFGRKAWAVDEHGKDLHIQNAAADLDMDDGNLRRAWRRLESENRVKREGQRLLICGDVRLPKFSVISPEDSEPDSDLKPKAATTPNLMAKKKRSEVCTDLSKPYILKQLNKLQLAKRKEVEDEYVREDRTEKKCISEAVAAVRSIFGKRKDNILRAVGVNVNRIEKDPDQPAEPAQEKLRLFFVEAIEPLVPEVVEFSSGSVQTSRTGPYRRGKTSVQSAPDQAMATPSLNQEREGREKREVGRQVEASVPEPETPTYLPTPALPIRSEHLDIAAFTDLADLVAAVEAVAVPVIAEKPTGAQYFEIHQKLQKGKTAPEYRVAQFRARMEAKKEKGKLNSVMVLTHLADDCAATKWTPPADAKTKEKAKLERMLEMANGIRGEES